MFSFLCFPFPLIVERKLTRQAYLFDNDERFFVGWELDKSFAFCTVSWSISLFCAIAVIVAARTLPPEGGYELIPSLARDAEEVH